MRRGSRWSQARIAGTTACASTWGTREVFEERRVEPLEVIDVDDERVISVVRVMGRSEKFGTEITADWAWLITLGRNRKGVRVETFTDKAQAPRSRLAAPGTAE